MSYSSFDPDGGARQALQDVYRNYGATGIDDEKLVGQLMPDLLPGEPAEAILMRAAASIGVGSLLADRVAGQMPAEAAVRDVAAILMERRAVDQNAALWVVNEYAAALGHPTAAPLDSTAPTTPSQPPSETPETAPIIGTAQPAGPQPLAQTAQFPAVTPNGGYPPDQYPPMPAVPGPYPSGGYQPASYPGGPYQPQANQRAGYPTQPSRTPLYIGLAVIAVLTVGAILAAFALTGPKSRATAGSGGTPAAVTTPAKPPTTTPTTPPPSTPPPTTPPPSTPPPSTPPPSTPPPSTPPVGQAPPGIPSLDALLPADLDVAADCQPSTDNATGTTGVLAHDDCTEPDSSTLPGALVFGYQMRDDASFNTSWDAMNAFLNFDPTDPGVDNSCPTSSSHGGATTWDDGGPTIGKIECFKSAKGTDVYLWSETNNRTILCVAGTPDQSRADVDTWWNDDSAGRNE